MTVPADHPHPDCRIGITGHRILAEQDRVRAGIDHALDRIAEADSRRLTVYSSLAEGADQLAAEAVLARPEGRLVAVLPFPLDRYTQVFESAPARAGFARLLALAQDVITLPPASTPGQAYENAGRFLLARCDVLLAVWDGNLAQGQGGTGEIVRAARALGKPCVIVRAGNRRAGTNEPTTLGDAQGQVILELPLVQDKETLNYAGCKERRRTRGDRGRNQQQ